MKANVKLTAGDLTDHLIVRNAADSDSQVVCEVEELKQFLGDVLFNLWLLKFRASERDEYSAQEIAKAVEALEDEIMAQIMERRN